MAANATGPVRRPRREPPVAAPRRTSPPAVIALPGVVEAAALPEPPRPGWRAMATGAPVSEARPEPERADSLTPLEPKREERQADWTGLAAEQLRRRASTAHAQAKVADDSVRARTGRTPLRQGAAAERGPPPPSLITGRPIRPAARGDETRRSLFEPEEEGEAGAGREHLRAMFERIFAETPDTEPIRSDERGILERLLGVDLSAVRIKADGDAADAVEEAGARAVAAGDRIVFSPGAYRPGSEGGLDLLAHEVAHTVQQGDAALAPERPAEPAARLAEGAAPAGPAAESLVLPPGLETPSGIPPLPEGEAPPPAPVMEGMSEAPNVAEPKPAPPPAGRPGGEADAVAAWRARLDSASSRVRANPPTPGAGTAVRQAGAVVRSALDVAAARVPDDASRVITPPERPPDDLPEPPDDATRAAMQAIQEAGSHTLNPFTLPAMAAETPLGRAVTIAASGPGAPTPSVPAPPGAAPGAGPATGPSTTAAAADRLGRSLAVPPTAATPGRGPALGASTITDTRPEAPPLTIGTQAATGQAIARLLLRADRETNQLVNGARRAAYRGGVESHTELTDTLKDREQEAYEAELHRIAIAAQISENALKGHVTEQRLELTRRHEVLAAERDEASEGTREEVRTAGATVTAEIDAARAALDRAAADRVAAARGDVDVAQVHAERDRLIARAETLETRAVSNYRTAVQTFKDALDAEAGRRRRAYQRVAEEDREQLRAGVTAAEALAGAERAFVPVRIWRDDQIRALDRELDRGKTAADTQVEGYCEGTRTKGEAAREAARDWAAHRLGYERSWLQRLFDWISDWRRRAERESAAWQDQQTQANLSATVESVAFVDAEVARLRGMSEAERAAEFTNLSAEQQAIIMAFFQNGGDRIEAVAAGLLGRITGQRRPEIVRQVEAAVLASADTDMQMEAATAVNESFTWNQVDTICTNLHTAFSGPGTEEPDVLNALRGLTALEGKLVEGYYEDTFHENLRERLRSELDDWATWSSHDIDRANSMLEGRNADAIAVELDQAMHGTWNGLGVGTDNDTIMRLMRGKSPSEIAEIRRAYRTRYGRDLDVEIQGELQDWFILDGTHDVDRFSALMRSDTAAADSIALDQSLHGGTLGLGIGTDRAGFESVYSQIDTEIEADANRYGWNSARVEAERRSRRLAVSGAYETRFGSLDAAVVDDSSDADRALMRGVSGADRDLTREGLDYASINASRIALERQAVFYHDDKVVGDAMSEPHRRLTAAAMRDATLDMNIQRQVDREMTDRGHLLEAWQTLEAARANRRGTARERSQREHDAIVAFGSVLARSGSLGAGEAFASISITTADPYAGDAAATRAYARFADRYIVPERARDTINEAEFNLRWSPQATAVRRAEVRRSAAATAAASAPREFEEMRTYYNAHYAGRPAAALFEMQDSGGDFDHDVRAMATSWTGDDTRTDPATHRVINEDRIGALLAQGGVLTETQEVTFAARGVGTDMDALRRVASGRSQAEMQELARNWEAEHPGENFNEFLFGTDDPTRSEGGFFEGEFSGRDWQDMREMFVYGEPITPADRAARAERQLAFERRSTNDWSNDEVAHLERRVGRLNVEVAAFRETERIARLPENANNYDLWRRYERSLASVEASARAVDASVAMHRKSVDVVADVAGQIAGAVVIAAAAVVGGIMTALSGGMLSGAAIAGIALVASLVGSALTMGVKAYYKGDAYGWEEFGVDMATAVVDAITSVLTAGMGDKLLKSMGGLKALVGRGGSAAILAGVLAEGIENILGTVPSTLTGVLMDPATYEGNAILNLLSATLMGTAQSLAVAAVAGKIIGGPMGHLGASVGNARVAARTRPMVPSIHGGPHVPVGHPHAAPDFHGPSANERVRAWYEFRQANKTGTLDEFRLHMQGAADASRAEAVAQGPRRRQELLAAVPPERRAAITDTPVEVVGPNEYRQRTGRDPEASHAAVIFDADGKPRVLVQPDAPPHAMYEEGLHLLQRTEAGHGERIASFERLTPQEFRALPVEQRSQVVRNYLDVELNAQERLIEGLKADLASPDPDVRRRAQDAIAHFEEKADLYRRQLAMLDNLSPEHLAALDQAGSLPPLLREAPVLQQKKSIASGRRPDIEGPLYGRERRSKTRLSDSTYEVHSLLKEHPKAELHTVGRPWVEEEVNGLQRRYRRVELVDADGKVIHTREEIESPKDSGRWRQRGSESAFAGGVMENASQRLIDSQIAKVAADPLAGGPRVMQLDPKHRGNAGFDNMKIEFFMENGKLTARLVQVEVKDYAGFVGFSSFTANARNVEANIAALREALLIQAFPSKAHRDAVSAALSERRFALEVHLGPTGKVGDSLDNPRGVLAKIERVQRIWHDLARVDGAATTPKAKAELAAVRERLMRALDPDVAFSERGILNALSWAEHRIADHAPDGMELGVWKFDRGFEAGGEHALNQNADQDLAVLRIPKDLVDLARLNSPTGQIVGQKFDVHPLRLAERSGFLTPGKYGAEPAPPSFGDNLHIIADRTGQPAVLNRPGRPNGPTFDPKVQADQLVAQLRHSNFGTPPSVGGQKVQHALSPLVDVSHLSTAQIESLCRELTNATAGHPELLGRIRFISPPAQLTAGQWNALFGRVLGRNNPSAKFLNRAQSLIIGQP